MDATCLLDGMQTLAETNEDVPGRGVSSNASVAEVGNTVVDHMPDF